MMAKSRTFLIVLLFVSAFGIFYAPAQTNQIQLGAQVGDQAIDFSLPVVGSWGEERQNLYGELVTTEQFLMSSYS